MFAAALCGNEKRASVTPIYVRQDLDTIDAPRSQLITLRFPRRACQPRSQSLSTLAFGGTGESGVCRAFAIVYHALSFLLSTGTTVSLSHCGGEHQ